MAGEQEIEGRRLEKDRATVMTEVRVAQDGKTLWVNGPDGSSIGRFSKTFGMDVHRSTAEQMSGLGQCLGCTHGPAGQKEWELFRSKMLEHHGVRLKAGLLRF